MLLGASICPHPPLLVPGGCQREPGWLGTLRDICVASVRRLSEPGGVERIVAVGSAEVANHWGADAGGTLRRFGVLASAGGPDHVLPLSLTVAASLLDSAGWDGLREYVAVPRHASPPDCAAAGRTIVTGSMRTALLVMGDGSAKRTTRAPGAFDQRAAGYDACVVTALATADTDTLLRLEPEQADELWVAGRAAWQALAGAATNLRPDPRAGRPIQASLRYDDAPLGVGYAVVDWSVLAT